MAPEIHLRQSYQGQLVDLFALGVIIFMLYSGSKPFTKATERDPLYKLITENRSHLFWKAHEQSKPRGFFSDDFKDLMNSMLAFQPYERLSIAEIVGHPWLSNDTETANDTELCCEFQARHVTIKKNAAKL